MQASFLIVVALALSCTVFTVIFALAYLHLGRRPHAKSWSLSFAVAALMFTSTLTKDSFPSQTFYWLLCTALSCSSVTIGIRGHLQRLGKPFSVYHLLVPVGVFAVVLWATLITPHMGLRISPLALHAGVSYTMVTWWIVSSRRISIAEWGMAGSCAAFALCQWAAGLVALSQGATLDSDLMSHYLAINYVGMPACFLGMGMFAVFSLASDLAEEMRQLASIDPLTGLANRRGMNDAMARAWASAQRTDRAVSILLADLDGFKRINDEHGHAAGDEVLKAVAERMAFGRRADDLVARWGGEEFVLLLAGPTHTQAAGIAEEIDARIQASTVETATGSIRPSASIGVATAHPGDSRLEDLIRLADERMYERKTARKAERARAAAQPQVDLTRAPTLMT
ncbi:MAG: GGDEF domain-containing protein [Pseudomonadota bacterium]